MISDRRIKKDIVASPVEQSIAFINGIEPCYFCLKQAVGEAGCHKIADGKELENGQSAVCNCSQSGFIAQNVLESAIKSGIPKTSSKIY